MYVWSMQHKVAAVVFGLVAYVTLFLVAMYVAGVLFLLLNLFNPSHAGIFSIVGYWLDYAHDEGRRTQLVLAIGAAAGGLLIVLPAVLLVRFRLQRLLFGDARLARHSEIRQSGLLNSTPPSIIAGRYRDRYLRLDGQRSVLVVAPARSGVGGGVVVPNLLNWQHSVVALDVTGESYEITAGLRAKHMGDVYAFSPFDGGSRSHRWNPLSIVRTSEVDRVADLFQIGRLLYPDQAPDSASALLNDQARDLFVALGLLLSESPELPFTMGEMQRLASGYGRPLMGHLRDLIKQRGREGRLLSNECADALRCALSVSEDTLSRTVATFEEPLSLFADRGVDAATSGNDFRLEDVRRRRMSIYVRIPLDRLVAARPLLNLFYGLLVQLNTRERPESDATLKYQCLLINDEFAAMGRMSVITSAAAHLGEYNLRLLTVVQTPADLNNLYGPSQARDFAGLHTLQIIFPPSQEGEAYQYSTMLDDRIRMAVSRGSGGFQLGRFLLSCLPHELHWPLLLPHEMQKLGSGCAIVTLKGCRPILARKIRFDKEPGLLKRVLEAPMVPRLDVERHEALVATCRRQICARRVADEADGFMALARDLSGPPKHRDHEVDPPGRSMSDAADDDEPDERWRQ